MPFHLARVSTPAIGHERAGWSSIGTRRRREGLAPGATTLRLQWRDRLGVAAHMGGPPMFLTAPS